MRVDGKQIYENFTEGDTRNLRSAADRISDLSDAYVDRGMAIKSLQSRMTSSWTGSAADAANAGAGPLEQAFRETADPLFTTKASVTTQADSFDDSGQTVVPVPPKPEKPNPWTTGLKGAIPIAGPFMVNNDIKNYQEGVAKHEAANQNNVRVMDQYDSVTSSTRSSLPTDYGVLKNDGANVSVKVGGGPPPIKPPPVIPVKPGKRGGGDDENDENDGTDTSGTNDNDNNQHQNQNQNQNQNKPGVGEDRPVNPRDKPGGDPNVTTPTRKPGPGDTTLPSGGGRGKPGQTTEIPGRDVGRGTGGNPDDVLGLTNGLNQNNGPGGGGANPPGSTGGGRNVAGPNSAAGRLLGGEGGTGGRAGGPGGPGSGGLGAGRGSGMGGLGGGMGGADHLAGGRGGAGRGGGQMGPMGAGGRRAEGDEDDEHQRPDYLIEADPDAIFGTDQRTSPPVIGE
ncbi:WXG100 family type VII secretion target [Amycolatopsis sp. cmx-11-32]|uniref:WXG100 family type VII secretion target n=1 Tax=Amycolatopsis sp. cmx-11-32 TaxID=2785796 RepID=UPI0039E50529